MPDATTAAVVLAAGKGTRFRSDLAKVLHPVAGRTMLRWILEALRPLTLERVVVVVGHQAERVRAEAEAAGLDNLVVVEQTEQRGTGHAVRVAADHGAIDEADRILVVPGDVPLVRPQTLAALLDAHGSGATVLTTELSDPAGYGRVLRNADGGVAGIVEDKDATDPQRAVTEVNSSIYVFDRRELVAELARLSADNAQGEEYLTDVIGVLAGHGRSVGAITGPPEVVAGVNDRAQLAHAGALLRQRLLDGHMRDGVTVVDPATTYVDADVVLEADSTLLPATHLEGRTIVRAGATIGPSTRVVDSEIERDATVSYSVLLEASVGPGATVGPFAYLRPGTRLEAGAKAGTFVEVKASVVGPGSKVPHLAYVGDARIGRDVNVGAGAVTVNYDGQEKHVTVIGDAAFIGSDTMLVAPVTIGEQAYTGAGSVITRDVPDGALAVERSEQRIVPDWAQRKKKP